MRREEWSEKGGGKSTEQVKGWSTCFPACGLWKTKTKTKTNVGSKTFIGYLVLLGSSTE